MNNLLIFFAFPIATIIISAILQKILKCPITVAAFIFAVFIVVTFAAFDETFLIATLAYTIIALITAFVVQLICRNNNGNNEKSLCERLEEAISNFSNSSNESNNGNCLCEALESITDDDSNNNFNCNNDNSANSNCGCSCNNRHRSYKYKRF